MTAVAHKQRLTLAVFDEADSVLPAVDALLDNGLEASQVGLAASSVALDRLEQVSRRLRFGHGWVKSVLPELRPAAAGVEATPGPLLSFLASRHKARQHRARRDVGLPDSLEAAFLGHIRAGRIVLGVSTTDSKQQWRSVRILLAQAAGEVRTFEFLPEDQENDASEA